MNAQPDIYRLCTDMEALHEGVRDRVEDLNISRLEFDERAGWAAGLASKYLADPPSKYIGRDNLPKMLKAAGLMIALVEADPGELEARKYSKDRVAKAAISRKEKRQEMAELQAQLSDYMRQIGAKGGKAGKGVKRKYREMNRRARQRRATHAARIMWEKRRARDNHKG